MGENEKIKIILKYSIPVRKEDGGMISVNELELGRLKAKHLKLLPKDFSEKGGNLEPSDIIPLIAGLTNIPLESADEIDLDDLGAIAEDLEGFLKKSLTTGEK